MDANQPTSLPIAHATEHDPPKVWVIAEIGVNHDGSVEQAVTLIDHAMEAGCNAVKFQLFRPERLLSAEASLATYQQSSADSPADLLEPLALSIESMAKLRDNARDAGIAFGVTPFSPDDVEDLKALGVDFIKIASPDAVNLPLIDRCLKLELPMVISTGACERHEVEPAATRLKQHKAGGALLQCVSSYPTPMKQAALGGVLALREAFGVRVGYSDHTASIETGALAVAAGACLLEKHLTHDPSALGPDHSASLSPTQMKAYVAHVRQAQSVLGPIRKTVQEVEQDVRRVSRQSVCAVRDLAEGHRVTREDLTIKRPGLGIHPERLNEVIGRSLRKAIKANHLLQDDHLV
ncbi:MAG: N-acetylneuraminate synthase family protein [Phycisphaeraceae bacterium]